MQRTSHSAHHPPLIREESKVTTVKSVRSLYSTTPLLPSPHHIGIHTRPLPLPGDTPSRTNSYPYNPQNTIPKRPSPSPNPNPPQRSNPYTPTRSRNRSTRSNTRSHRAAHRAFRRPRRRRLPSRVSQVIVRTATSSLMRTCFSGAAGARGAVAVASGTGLQNLASRCVDVTLLSYGPYPPPTSTGCGGNATPASLCSQFPSTAPGPNPALYTYSAHPPASSLPTRPRNAAPRSTPACACRRPGSSPATAPPSGPPRRTPRPART